MPKSGPEIPLHLFQVLEEEYLNLHGPLENEEDDIELPASLAGRKTYRRVKAARDWLFRRGHVKSPLSLVLRLLTPDERASLGPAAAASAPAQTGGAEALPVSGGAERRALAGVTGGALVERVRESLPPDELKAIYRTLTQFAGALDSLFDEVVLPDVPPAPAGRPETAEEELARRQAEVARAAAEKKRDAGDALSRLERGLNAILEDPEERLYTAERFRHVTLGDVTQMLVREGVSTFGERVLYTGDDLVQFKRLLLEDAFPEELERVSKVRLAAISRHMHSEGQAALCLSGGGIRSGTFALGLMQGLASRGLLGQFRYLSTVSGGGYIGGWLSAWIHRHRDGLNGVQEDMRNSPPESPIDPDPEPLRHLRRYSNFITPQVGLLTADTWTFVTIYLRNLLLNWSVLMPLLLGWLMLPRLYNSVLLARAGGAAETREGAWVLVAGRSLQGRHALLALGCALAVVAIAYVAFNRPYLRELLKVRSPFWYRRTGQRSFLLWCLLPLTCAAVCITIYWAWSQQAHAYAQAHSNVAATADVSDARRFADYVVFGALLCALGWAAAMCVLRRLPWGALALVGALLWVYVAAGEGDLWSARGLAPVVILALAAAAELYIVRRVTHVPYAQVREAFRLESLFEVGSLTLAGVIGGAFLWLSESVPNPTHHSITAGWTTWTTEMYTCLAMPVFLGGFLLTLTIFIGLTSHSKKFTDEDREWWARAGAWIFIVVIAWVTFSSLVVFAPLLLLYAPKLVASAGGASGLLALLAGHSSKTPARGDKTADEGPLASLVGSALPLLAMLFLAIFVSLLSLLTSVAVVGLAAGLEGAYGWPPWVSLLGRAFRLFTSENGPPLYTFGYGAPLTHVWAVHYPSALLALALMAGLLGLGFVMARLVNLNRFSLHAGYRDRLIRGFLGASRGERVRRPNPFTGFDPLDDVRMHDLRPSLLSEGDFINIGQLAERLRRREDAVSRYLWDGGALGEETKEEVEAYSADALPSQSLKDALIRDLNDAVENLDRPLYRAEPFQALREQEPAHKIIKWARSQPPDLLEQYRRSPYAILLNRVLLQLAYPEEIRAKYPPPHGVMHVVNTTLNLVGGDNLAWQQRKAEPFSVTPLHSGCFRLGYRSSRFYGGEAGIKLGTAVAISGAAASSNMGYYTTSPAISMVLTLFNVRLGWWLGNPGPAGQTTYTRQSPVYSIAPVVAEAFGLTDDRSKYVYLTDGGHFENLALYEMILRRCRLIVLSDAAADEKYEFNDLGNAVRKIRIDLGVPVEFGKVRIFGGRLDGDGGGGKPAGTYWAVARIRYSFVDKDAEDGLLVYVKPAVYGGEPQDVLHYKRSHKEFPHETTADQFFDEPQFESYRALGAHIVGRMYDETGAVSGLEELGAKLYWHALGGGDCPEVNAGWLEPFRPPAAPPQNGDPEPEAG